MNECLLTVIATPSLEEKLVDWLLEKGQAGFTTSECSGHGVNQEHLSAAEQVAGRQKRVAFWIQVPEPKARKIVAQLGSDFGAAGLHYWVSPVIAGGAINRHDHDHDSAAAASD